ncbi:MAG TPA: asparagine synthase (glutamine-hydrolyzing), partial [Candidatus Dormibacteraeota bacterium]
RDRELLEAMTQVQRHRGPDDEGFLETECASLGFRRLSIIDVAHGQQPTATPDGRIHLVYNGEVYNYRELREELRGLGHRFGTDSDSEVVLHAYEQWGPQCFARFNGMWGLALLDRRGPSPQLVLSRDHFGIKPLHWARSGDRVLFASEIKGLLADPALAVAPDEQTVHDYLLTGLHDHTPQTFFAGVRRVSAAHCAVIDGDGRYREHRYWEPRLSRDGVADPARFRELFMRSVERRLVAEVPVGTCLSGGLDSSSIVCAMDRLLSDHVPDAASIGDHLKTFSAVFDGDPIDEREYIRAVLDIVDADPTFVHPSSERFFEELEEFVWHLEEPTVSTGPYAQWCVQREAGKHVTVLLDGQGGDELLAGYVPYQWYFLRQLLGERRWARLVREAWLGRDVLWPLLRRRLGERRKAFPVASLLDRTWLARQPPVRDERVSTPLKERLLQDLLASSLPSALRYEDRNAMAHSVEARLPFLDQELVDWVLTLPEEAFVRDGWARILLREGLADLLPDKVRRRRWKVGFTTPEMRWLRAQRVIVQGLLRSPSFCARPYWDGLAIAEMWHRACLGEVDDSLFFWRVLNLEVWLRVFMDARTRPQNAARAGTFQEHGDRATAARLPAAAAALSAMRPNPGRHLFAVAADGRIRARAPLRSALIGPGDDLAAALCAALCPLLEGGQALRPGDLVAISEKVVAISQGRSQPIAGIRPHGLARNLSRFVRRTPIGIGLGTPATMQLAIDEAGAPRILAAAAAAAVTRPLGRRGVFYRIAGPSVAAIDGPTPHTMPPYNAHAKRAPLDSRGVAARLAAALSADAGGSVDVAIVDSNDLGAQILGATAGVDAPTLVELLRDNPLGQQRQSTPFLLVREVGPLSALES